MLYTSYYAKLKQLPKSIYPIAISIGKPERINIPRYTKLQPTRFILMEWKLTNDIDKYKLSYTSKVLSKLNPKEVYNELMSLSNEKDVCLICYEKPSNFCHRTLVAEWFSSHGIPCEEYTYEEQQK